MTENHGNPPTDPANPTDAHTQDLPPDVQTRLDTHLDAIDQVLTDQGEDRSARRTITDEVESHIREQLAQRTAPNAPTVADLEAVLAEMDPPEAYGQGTDDRSPTRQQTDAATTAPGYSRPAVRGLIIGFLGPFLASIFLLLGETSSSQPATVQSIVFGILGLGLFVVSVVTMVVLGIIALNRIKRSNGRLRGKGLAIFDIAFWPVLLLFLTIVTILQTNRSAKITASHQPDHHAVAPAEPRAK